MGLTWAEIVPRLREAAKRERGTQNRIALRFDLREDEVTRIMKGTQVPDPVLGNSLVKELLGLPLSVLLGEPSPVAPLIESFGASLSGVPLVARDVAAGEARVPTLDEAGPDSIYFFRQDWLQKRHGWNGRSDRFFCIRLAKAVTEAGSMEPTIYANSIVLCDKHPTIARERLQDRSIWLVNEDGGLAVKRVTRQNGTLLLESDAVGRKFAPRTLHLKGKDISHVLPGKVLWWGTNAVYAEEQ